MRPAFNRAVVWQDGFHTYVPARASRPPYPFAVIVRAEDVRRPRIDEVQRFVADPPPKEFSTHSKDLIITRTDFEKILKDWHPVSREH